MMIVESAILPDWIPVLTAWLFTYLLHSTLLLTIAWVLTCFPVSRNIAQLEWIWKGALFGGVLTATLQFAGGMHPIAGTHHLSAFSILSSSTLPATASGYNSTPFLRRENQQAYRIQPEALYQNSSRTVIASRQSPGSWHLYIHRQEAFLRPAGALQSSTTIALNRPQDAASALPPQASSAASWMYWLVALWLLGVTISLVRYKLARRTIRQLLRRRQLVADEAILQMLRDLCHSAGFKKVIILTASADLQSPLALPANEICLPLRALSELERPQLQSMLAHELAHLQRRDPLWLALQALLRGIFFFQPLNLLARKHLRETSEFLCDDWAVRHTGHSVGLAHCLSRVAEWMLGNSFPHHVAAMHHQSPLKRRVMRLLDNRSELAATPSRYYMCTLLLLILAIFTLVAPSISSPATFTPDPVPTPGHMDIAPQARTVVNTAIEIHFANRRFNNGQVQEFVYQSHRTEITY